MALLQSLLQIPTSHCILAVILLLLTFLLSRSLYRVFFHPLHHIPGPRRSALSSAFLNFHAYVGDECSTLHSLHKEYGTILRIGPNDVDITDGDALAPIYAEKGGFRKAAFYANFDIDGHKSIFSETQPDSRALRSKAVLPLFSTASLRSEHGRQTIQRSVDKFAMKLEDERQKARGTPVNVLNLTRGLALDAVTSFLFQRSYDGLDEDARDGEADVEARMSACHMVDAFVAVGRFFYLPNWFFQWVTWTSEKITRNKDVGESIETVDRFVAQVVTAAMQERITGKCSGSYQARLLEAGISESETRAQCKDLIFAGTDSTGMNLATICFLLTKYPAKYGKLREELGNSKHREEDLQSLPYLRGVIREGLRLSMANPSRLPRVVPSGGWTFKGTYLPEGTLVSCTPFELHLNGAVYHDPEAFEPERWANPTEAMNRDSIPFGLGSRQCIARNLATMELYCAVYKLVDSDILRGARCIQEKIKILEWFNSKVIGEKIEIAWDGDVN